MTETSRRTVLRAGALAAAAAPLVAPAAASAAGGRSGAPAGSTAGAGPRRPTIARPLYRRSRFAPYVGQSFLVIDPAGRRPMTLTGVGDRAVGRPADERSFTLTFTADEPGPAQGTFLVRRTGFPSTTLFLVPSDPDRRTYQAIINTL